MACSIAAASRAYCFSSFDHIVVPAAVARSTVALWILLAVRGTVLLRDSIMLTRSSAARLKKPVAACPSPSSPPTALAPRTSNKRRTPSTARTTTTSSVPLPANRTKRAKPDPSITAVNRQTTVELSTLHTYLGHLIPVVNGGQAKGGVVAALTQLLPAHSATDSGHSHYPHPVRLPSFNRLCGWLHLHNALCLFINVPPITTTATTTSSSTSPTTHYNNLFTRHRHTRRLSFTWYTPPTVHPSHPLVHALTTAATHNDAMTVLLFCRRTVVAPRRGSGSTEGYRYYGRVAYASHDAAVRPMSFVLELVDAERVEAVMLQEQLQHDKSSAIDSDSS